MLMVTADLQVVIMSVAVSRQPCAVAPADKNPDVVPQAARGCGAWGFDFLATAGMDNNFNSFSY